MKTYDVYITQTDSTQVDAESVEEAEQLAWTVFKESNYNLYNAQLDVYEAET